MICFIGGAMETKGNEKSLNKIKDSVKINSKIIWPNKALTVF